MYEWSQEELEIAMAAAKELEIAMAAATEEDTFEEDEPPCATNLTRIDAELEDETLRERLVNVEDLEFETFKRQETELYNSSWDKIAQASREGMAFDAEKAAGYTPPAVDIPNIEKRCEDFFGRIQLPTGTLLKKVGIDTPIVATNTTSPVGTELPPVEENANKTASTSAPPTNNDNSLVFGSPSTSSSVGFLQLQMVCYHSVSCTNCSCTIQANPHPADPLIYQPEN